MATQRGGVNVPISATWNGRALKQAESQLGSFKKSFGKAFMGIGAAAGAAVGVGALSNALLSMAQNAAEDQQSLATLSKTLTNLGLGASQRQVEDFISALSLQTGVVDDELRPAFDRLVRSTGNVEEAQRATTIALDAAKSSGRSVVDVAMLLGKAYDGNTMALARAGLGIDTAILKTKDMGKITAELARITGGQAAIAAATYSGQLQRLNVAATEAGEAVGYELLRALETVGNQMGGTGGFSESITTAGDVLAGFVAGVSDGTIELLKFGKAAAGVVPGVDETETSFGDMLLTVAKLTPGLGLLTTTTEGLVRSGQENIRVNDELVEELNRAAMMRDVYAGKTRKSTYGTEEDTDAVEDNRTALERLRDTLDKFNGRNRSIIGQRIDLRQGFAQGPQGEMVGTGKKRREVITADDAKKWALQQAATAESLAQQVFDAGGKGSRARAARITDDARARITAELRANGVNRPVAFANSILSTPGEYRPGSPGTRNGPNGGVTYVYQFGDIKVDSSAALRQAQIEAARLAALSGGRYAGMAETGRGYQK